MFSLQFSAPHGVTFPQITACVLFLVTPADLTVTSFTPTCTCFHSPAQETSRPSMSVVFHWPPSQTSRYLLSTCIARKVWNHFRKISQGSVKRTVPARGQLWQLAVCGNRYLQSHPWHAGQEAVWYKKSPDFTLKAFIPAAKPA